MNYLQKLTDLICQEKDIEKDLKELRMGCKVGYTIEQEGCSNPSHGLTRECRYTYAPCWTKAEKIIEHTIMSKTNSTRNAIIQGNTSFGFKDSSLYFNSEGRLIFLNEGEYNNYRSKYFEKLNENPLGVFYCDKIIGNTLELHHLMWYANNKNIMYSQAGNLITFGISENNIKISYNAKKPLSQQGEEVLKNIFEALSF